MVLVLEPALFKAWKIFIDLILIDDFETRVSGTV